MRSRRSRKRVGLRLAVGLVCAVAATLAVLTVRRNRLYHDEIRMWRDVVRLCPNNYRGHDRLGVALLQQEKVDEAIKHHRRALKLEPAHVQGYYNLGVALAKKGLLDEAAASYRRAIRLGRH